VAARDDFSAAVKDSLAKRAGHKCSCPWCGFSTSGPSSESDQSVSNIGVAAHITAAAPGGPRYDPMMSSSARQSVGNGVWLCQVHAKLVDDDEHRFTVDLLRGWQRRAEEIALYAMGGDWHDDEEPVDGADRWRWRDSLIESHNLTDGRLIVPYSTRVALDSTQMFHRRIHQFLSDVGVTHGWGKVGAELVRLLVYEIAYNAFRHGGSSSITLTSFDSSVCVSHNGMRFGLRDLEGTEGGGGKVALDAFRNGARGALALSYRFRDDRNEWYISDLVVDDGLSNPCGLHLRDADQELVTQSTAERLSGCDEIHIYPPEFFSFSGARVLSDEIVIALPKLPLVIHGVDPESPLGQYVREKIPQIKFVY
jgi:hypothetical protein